MPTLNGIFCLPRTLGLGFYEVAAAEVAVSLRAAITGSMAELRRSSRLIAPKKPCFGDLILIASRFCLRSPCRTNASISASRNFTWSSAWDDRPFLRSVTFGRFEILSVSEKGFDKLLWVALAGAELSLTEWSRCSVQATSAAHLILRLTAMQKLR